MVVCWRDLQCVIESNTLNWLLLLLSVSMFFGIKVMFPHIYFRLRDELYFNNKKKWLKLSDYFINDNQFPRGDNYIVFWTKSDWWVSTLWLSVVPYNRVPQFICMLDEKYFYLKLYAPLDISKISTFEWWYGSWYVFVNSFYAKKTYLPLCVPRSDVQIEITSNKKIRIRLWKRLDVVYIWDIIFMSWSLDELG